ncbi:Single-stranded DNA-binding protein [bioreactor metagenome]|uniref:Single-stranded DNA-binding protein n=1 Tax=bioreactor metagenome TaxID=1076179 RepID=A0A645ANM5_9ZZZZ
MNKVILMGRLTDNPVVRQTQSGVSVASFTLAVNRPFVKQGEERKADFIDIVTWRSTADFVGKYFTKGQQVAVCGALQMRDWVDKEGKKRRTFEVVADEVFFADSKRDGAPARREEGTAAAGYQAPSYSAPEARFEAITEDDGLPF